MNVTFLIITAIAVSVDAFFCGLTVSVKKSNKFITLTGVILSVFVVCFCGSLLGNLLGAHFKNFASLTSGIIFLLVGVFSIIESKKPKRKQLTYSFVQSLILGISVGLDGALGCFNLTTLGYNAFLATFTVCLVHAIFMVASFFIGGVCNQKIKFAKAISPLILIALGVYKIASFL